VNIWTVYRSPLDFPGKFIARRFVLDKPTRDVIIADTLEEIRERLSRKGLARFGRFEGDDPVIVETWL